MPLALFGFLNLTLTDVLDILMVSLIIFFVFKWIRGSSAMSIFMALLLLYVVKVVVSALNMTMMSGIMDTVVDVGVLALIILFQPEIRYFLIKVGSKYGLGGSGWKIFDRMLGRRPGEMGSEATTELCEAVREMSHRKTGALIVLTRQDNLTHIVETGDQIDAIVSHRLLENIFFKNSPLHDGAVIISGDRIIAARCTLPLTARTNVPAHYGMRHKAAIGASEESDCRVIVVSEETGTISLAVDGKISTVRDIITLKSLLQQGGESKDSTTK